jgi:pSer/pThr/pTyr-binding forkhead associated (FHA) protein
MTGSLQSMLPWASRPVSELRALAPGFFVRMSSLQRPTGPMRTEEFVGLNDTVEATISIMAAVRLPTSQLQFISIGRIDGNDILLHDVSVSKFHAFIRDVDGIQLLQDAGSRNGTFVNNIAVPAQKTGAPVALRSGDVVRFGSVQTTYYDAAALHAFLQRMS